MELCERLKQIRKDNNLTQQELADVLCLSRTVITKFERGHRIPSLDTIIRISNYFNTSVLDEYKDKLKLFILSLRCIYPYLISVFILIVSSISLMCNVIKINNQYGYNIYNDELKVKNSEEICIVKSVFSNEDNEYSKLVCVFTLLDIIEFNSEIFISNNKIINDSEYYLFFINEEINTPIGYHYNVIDKIYKPFIYPLKDYDESLSYNEQTGECSKILNYYINLIEKVR